MDGSLGPEGGVRTLRFGSVVCARLRRLVDASGMAGMLLVCAGSMGHDY
jgi:hypothetical protein